MRGAADGKEVVPLATDGFIRSGHFASSGLYASPNDSSVYAIRVFDETVRRIGAEGRWTRIGAGGKETLALAIAANDSVKTDLLQLTVRVDGWEVSARRGRDRRRTVMGGKFDPPLELDREYRFEMDAGIDEVTVRLPGVRRKGRVGTVGLLGNRAFWQLYAAPAALPMGEKVSVNMAWVAVDGQPISPLPAQE